MKRQRQNFLWLIIIKHGNTSVKVWSELLINRQILNGNFLVVAFVMIVNSCEG